MKQLHFHMTIAFAETFAMAHIWTWGTKSNNS